MVCLVDGGRHPPLAYKTALALIVSLQVIAIIWIARPDRRLAAAILRTLRPMHKEIARHAYERKPAD
jgi:predicted Co/Zn/Cd cation transporter (cation efflux family)